MARMCFSMPFLHDAARPPPSPTKPHRPHTHPHTTPHSVVNAPLAGATLVLLGASATLDRAADSASRVRVTLIGAPPGLASVPIAAAPDGSRASPPQLQATAAALAALPARAPIVLVGVGPDGAQKTVVLSLADAPERAQFLAADATSPARVALDGDVVTGPADMSLSRGAAAAYVAGPGRLTRASIPARATFGGGGAVYIDVRW